MPLSIFFFFFLASVFVCCFFFPAFRKLFCLPTLPMLSRPRCTRVEKCVHFEGLSLLFPKCEEEARAGCLHYVRFAWARASLLFFLISLRAARDPGTKLRRAKKEKSSSLCFFSFLLTPWIFFSFFAVFRKLFRFA
uniref:Uncharacterized protein n=1 Tax=Ixodes ricinus TaxID=34613 RepID=A0A6B0US62_IXORI